ncbi:hypothetical protein [Albidovulum sediminis]|uniref:Uncharacterized protein n=1 Tax=Albidovulum sediminis TaxID=3066345 RepID=A0ABT2NLF1_9RHOB|nr:hypothetical protein [Defluviimonas sediminis]MCT8329742.1 hypothetical protein [Defluviimonas sediminis]
MTDMPISRPRPARSWFHHIPVVGWIAYDIAHGDSDTIWYALVILLTALVLAVKTWGLVALAMTALAAVPVIFATLILITIGK